MLNQIFLLALNHLLRGESWARAALSPYAGSSVRIIAAPIRLVVVITAEGALAEGAAEAVDAEFVLPDSAVLGAFKGRQELIRTARISGRADLAEVFGMVLRELRWDYEEDLSRLVGDIPARRLTALGRGLGAWPRAAVHNFGANLSEYLREEQPLLASKPVVVRLGECLDDLGVALDHLEERIVRLETRRYGA